MTMEGKDAASVRERAHGRQGSDEGRLGHVLSSLLHQARTVEPLSPGKEEPQQRFGAGEVRNGPAGEKEPAEVRAGDGLAQEAANYSLGARCGPWPGFINKVLLALSHAHSLMYCLRGFCCQGQAGQSRQTPPGPQAGDALCSGPFQPDLEG